MRWMWIDRIVELEPRTRLVAIKNVSMAEDHLHDHFAASGGRAAKPVMPASLIIEGMAQSAGILVGHAGAFKEKVVLAKVSKAELDLDAAPGDQVWHTATIASMTDVGASTTGVVGLLRPGATERVEIGRIDLVFSHLDNNLAGAEFPKDNFVFGDMFRNLLRSSGVEPPPSADE